MTTMTVAQFPAANAALELVTREVAPRLCAGITTFNALRNSPARPGDLVAVQGLGGLGHLAVQFAHRMGFRTVAIARGDDKRPLATQLGADEYVDSAKGSAGQALAAMGGARVVLATAPNAAAVEDVMGGLGVAGQLLLIAAVAEPLRVSTLPLDRKSTRLNSSHLGISYAVFCLKKKKKRKHAHARERKTQDEDNERDEATRLAQQRATAVDDSVRSPTDLRSRTQLSQVHSAHQL